MNSIKPFAILTGAILAGSGAITMGLAGIPRPFNDFVFSVGILLVIIGLATLALNWTPSAIILRDAWNLICVPFRWIAFAYRSQWH